MIYMHAHRATCTMAIIMLLATTAAEEQSISILGYTQLNIYIIYNHSNGKCQGYVSLLHSQQTCYDLD